MLTTCRYCNGIHDSSYECEKKAEAIKKRDKYLCIYSLSKGVIETHDLEVHHIVPIKEDWSKRLDDNNLITLTRLVHEQAEDGTISREKLLNLLSPPMWLRFKRKKIDDRATVSKTHKICKMNLYMIKKLKNIQQRKEDINGTTYKIGKTAPRMQSN